MEDEKERQRKKIGLLATLRVLQEYSDNEIYMSREQIQYYVEKEYGITINRGTVRRYMRHLRTVGFDVIGYQKDHAGYELITRTFKENEVLKMMNTFKKSGEFSEDELNNLLEGLTIDFTYRAQRRIAKKLNLQIPYTRGKRGRKKSYDSFW